ncbi:MAG TPA: VanW family protein [Firmicutes bacterium]|nr:VanW family protein [Bacillota bacterium]
MPLYAYPEKGEHEIVFLAKVAILRLGRWLRWLSTARSFARDFCGQMPVSDVRVSFPFLVFDHSTPLIRDLKGAQYYLQYNKITNLKLACAKLDGLVLRPGKVFSFWYLVGPTSKRKGYLEGIEFRNGKVSSGIGGGLCQLSNMLYWAALHLNMDIVERHRHSYDFFPDSHRTQPFGTGATVFYNYVDLQFRNPHSITFLFRLSVTETQLVLEVYADKEPDFRVQVIETDHRFIEENGMKLRCNRIHRLVTDKTGRTIKAETVAENRAIVLY